MTLPAALILARPSPSGHRHARLETATHEYLAREKEGVVVVERRAIRGYWKWERVEGGWPEEGWENG
jgi:hypothetical protein